MIASMAGSSIAAPDAAPWLTDFLIAADFRRRERDLDDLRLAACVVTTPWWRRTSGRLHATDLPAFVRAFGAGWLKGLGTLDRAALLSGGKRLLGDWFAVGYRLAGRAAQQAFWGTDERRSTLVQLARSLEA